MILGYDLDIPVGTVMQGARDVHGCFHDVAWKVIRPATEEEWIACCKEQGATDLAIQQVIKFEPWKYFYEVSMD